MKIDILKQVQFVGVHPVIEGKRYCFVHDNGYEDCYSIGKKFAWRNAVSVLFTEQELKEFRPNDTVHSFLQELEADAKKELKRLKNYKKSVFCNEADKKRINERVEFIKETAFRFVELHFIEE